MVFVEETLSDVCLKLHICQQQHRKINRSITASTIFYLAARVCGIHSVYALATCVECNNRFFGTHAHNKTSATTAATTQSTAQ